MFGIQHLGGFEISKSLKLWSPADSAYSIFKSPKPAGGLMPNTPNTPNVNHSRVWRGPAEDYLGMARPVPLISHLQAPASFACFRADRFSPVFNEPQRFGLVLRPYASYALCYPGDEVDLDKIAYFFTHDAPRDAETVAAVGTAWEATEAWRRESANCTFVGVDSGQFLALLDNRLGRAPARHLLTGARRAIYRMLDSAISLRGLLQALSARYPVYHWSEDDVWEILDEFESNGLSMREDNLHLALAVLPPEEEEAARSAKIDVETEPAL